MGIPDWLLIPIVAIVGFLSIFWIVTSISIAQGVGRTQISKVLIALFFIPVPFVYFFGPGWHDNYKWKHARKLESEVIAKTLRHLSLLCEQEERFSVKLPFARDTGVFYISSVRDDELLDFQNQPLKEYPIPKSGIPRWWEDVKNSWYGNYFSPPRHEQFLHPVKWNRNIRSNSILEVLGSGSFVENGYARSGQTGKKFDYWRSENRGEPIKDGGNVHTKPSSHINEPNPQQQHFSYSVDDLKAKYELVADDISTVDDRRNWIARGRLRLVDRKTSDVVAEYVGFSANLSLIRRQHAKPWNRIQVCPKAMQESPSTGGEPWDAGHFFFSRILKTPIGNSKDSGLH